MSHAQSNAQAAEALRRLVTGCRPQGAVASPEIREGTPQRYGGS